MMIIHHFLFLIFDQSYEDNHCKALASIVN